MFLAVLGAVMLTLFSLSRIARYAGEDVNHEPMDYDPSTVDPFEEGHIRNVRTTGEER